MGYYLQAIIFKSQDVSEFAKAYKSIFINELSKGLAVIPMTEELFDEINNYNNSETYDDFQFMSLHLENELLQNAKGKMFAYVEAEYHGGTGGQVGILWENNMRKMYLNYGPNRINQILKEFGIKISGKYSQVIPADYYDEFIEAGFGSIRNTKDLLS